MHSPLVLQTVPFIGGGCKSERRKYARWKSRPDQSTRLYVERRKAEWKEGHRKSARAFRIVSTFVASKDNPWDVASEPLLAH